MTFITVKLRAKTLLISCINPLMYYILSATFITDCTWCYVYYRLHNIGYLYHKLSTIPTCRHVLYLNGCQHCLLLATSITNYYQYNTLIILHPHYTLLVPYYVYLYSALPVLQISGSVTCFTETPSLHVIMFTYTPPYLCYRFRAQ